MKILIDAGHGGYDPGAVGTWSKYGGSPETVYEKDLNLSFAKELKGQIEWQLGATVVMTRDSDTFVDINPRWQLGQSENVDAVISIHFNASSNKTVEGTEIYYAQNRPDDIPYCQALMDGIMSMFGRTNRGIIDDTKSAPGSLGILRYPSLTSYPRALIEVEYISNYDAMTNNIGYDYYERILDFTSGVTRGLRNYFNL